MLIPRQGPEDPGCSKVGTVAVTAVGVTQGVDVGEAGSVVVSLMIHLLWVLARRGI